ncbi:LysR substrate-binding domain-containing protein [Phenylobacterium sp. J367]|uniref:LysR substrate-binding domain-containing protein n=1 Tax=Phenylobacterium sp. J367 TaxID=2898435 RepID=UPI002150EA91|nr:LysR substrate-binding domain-containing protein [Phenylobacterium sp. J367]MCR5879940.1 LysR substrate-binding domain-containing protein [Phenylobacterium sp. J367]
MSDVLATLPLSAIRVFEAAARLGSFTRAADELGMTQAAVSWQVKALETRLDQPLFRRLPREVALTPAGERLARAATEATTALRGALADILDKSDGVLAISTLQTLAMQWLAPRIGAFQVAHPQIAVRVETSNRIVDLLREDVDVAIRAGKGDWPDLETVRLFSAVETPVATPELLARLGPIAGPADLLDLPRIGAGWEWDLWFRAAGVTPPPGKLDVTPRLAGDAQILEVAAALAGQGFALASPILYAADIASGRLAQPFEVTVPMGQAYWLVYPKDRRRTRKIAAFRDWLLESVSNDPAVARWNTL